MHGLKRIFYDGTLSGVIELDEDTSRRLKTVLRAESGDKLEIMSNDDIGLGEICVAGKKSIQVRVDSVRELQKPTYSFTVYQCAMKREYMDAVVEKYTELGVTKIVPVISARSNKDMKPNTYGRYKSIIIDAAIQSEQEFIPEITKAIELDKIKANHTSNILFHERAGEKNFPKTISNDVGIVIGPEGGFTESELDYLIKCGFSAYTPIDCVLKAETAAVLFAGAVRMRLNGSL